MRAQLSMEVLSESGTRGNDAPRLEVDSWRRGGGAAAQRWPTTAGREGGQPRRAGGGRSGPSFCRTYTRSSTFRRPVTDLDLDLDPNFPGARTTVGNMSFHEQQSKVREFRVAVASVWLIVVSEAQDDGQWRPPGANLGQPVGLVLAHLRRAPLDRVRGHPRQRHNQVHNSFAPTCLQSSP